mmetsp:Transcript_21411/g.33498  ORF Transcript_21411/g.33498 Transcript_21411/m.33498 type:complete len:90 (-) Transcript_21411:97-366(-)
MRRMDHRLAARSFYRSRSISLTTLHLAARFCNRPSAARSTAGLPSFRLENLGWRKPFYAYEDHERDSADLGQGLGGQGDSERPVLEFVK